MLSLYRARAKSSQIGGGALATGAIQTVPSELMVQASYGIRITRRFRTSVLAEGHYFDQTPTFQARDVFDIGIAPTYRLSQETSVVTRFIYTTGTISGFDGGVGLSVLL